MSNLVRITLGLIAVVFGLLMIFANLSIHFNLFSYTVIMKVIGLTMSTSMAGIFAYWLKKDDTAETFKDVV